MGSHYEKHGDQILPGATDTSDAAQAPTRPRTFADKVRDDPLRYQKNLRDEFAMVYTQASIIHQAARGGTFADMAVSAYAWADRMLERREKVS